MKRETLAELGLEKETIDKIMAINGDDINKAKGNLAETKQRVEELENTIATLQENASDVEELRNKLTEYEQAEVSRKAQEEAKRVDDELNSKIADAIGDRTFINEFTKSDVYAKLKAGLTDENNTKTVGELLDDMTKDIENVFVNPQQEKLELPKVEDTTGEPDDNFIRRVMGLPEK